MTTLVKLTETKLDFQVYIAKKTIEENSERNQKFKCNRPEPFISGCATSLQIEAHVRKQIT